MNHLFLHFLAFKEFNVALETKIELLHANPNPTPSSHISLFFIRLRLHTVTIKSKKASPLVNQCFLKLGHSRPLCSLFSSFQQLTENLFIIKSCQWLDSNCGTLVSEATILPSEPQPLPKVNQCYNWTIHNCNLNCTSPNWNLYLFTTTLEM